MSFSIFRFLLKLAWGFVVVGIFASGSGGVLGQVVINEFSAAHSDRYLVRNEQGYEQLGCLTAWHEPLFVPVGWKTGTAPFGFGYPGLGTNVQGDIVNKTYSLYLRKTFTVTAAQAASADAVEVVLEYDDGFVAYLNGKEVARRNVGPNGAFVFRDQNAYNQNVASAPQTLVLGVASSLLRAGENVWAIQVHNNSLADPVQLSDTKLLMKTDLRLSPPSPAAPTVLVAHNSPGWLYFPGIAEPSGGFYDPALLSLAQTRGSRVWAGFDYDDSTWAEHVMPMGFDLFGSYGGLPAATESVFQGQVRNIASSVYVRKEFILTQAEWDDVSIVTITLDYDDGAVLFVNGQEVSRVNVAGAPGSFTSYSQLAASARQASPKGGAIHTVTLNKSQLQAGVNVVGIQWVNITAGNDDMYLSASLVTSNPSGTATPRIPVGDSWKFYVGVNEPPPTLDAGVEAPEAEFVDWLELKNTSNQPIDLAGWALTDAADALRKWVFASTVLPANGFLVVATDGLDIKFPPLGGLPHTNFGINPNGEFLALVSPSGDVVHSLADFPGQDYAHTYGLDAQGQWKFFSRGTPGMENALATAKGPRVSKPVFDKDTGFYADDVILSLTTPTVGAEIRYTLDGSEPTAATGSVYVGPFSPMPTRPGQGSGSLLREVWTGVTASGIAAIPVANPPTYIDFVGTSEAPVNIGDNYGQRLRGWITPPTTGAWEFWIASDDPGELWLSPTESPAQKVRIAQCPSAVGVRVWTTHAAQASVAQSLVAGQRYYIEILQKENTGGDHVSVSWRGPGVSQGLIPASALESAAPPAGVSRLVQARSAVVTAKAFAPGALPSRAVVRNYMVDFDPRLNSVPALVLSGDQGQTFYPPNGVTTISGGSFEAATVGAADRTWKPVKWKDDTPATTRSADTSYTNYLEDRATSYNIPMQGGRSFERSAQFELIQPTGLVDVRTECGIRVSGSPHARPRYLMQNLAATTWSATWQNKPSFNLFFRDDYEGGVLNYRLFPESKVTTWSSVRHRAGKNDAYNPFIVDEFMRRLSFDTKEPALIGRLVTYFINGHFKGYYNLTGHGREEFLQEWHEAADEWDVRQVAVMADGDTVSYNADMAYLNSLTATASDGGATVTQAEYLGAMARFDLDNYANYILVNAWGATGDWPHNNYICARPRKPGGRWIWLTWDAEGALGGFNKLINYNVFKSDLTSANAGSHLTVRPYWILKQNLEFRLKFADKVQKHLFNDGALTIQNVTRRWSELRTEINPVRQAVFGSNIDESKFNTWVVTPSTETTPNRLSNFWRFLKDPDEVPTTDDSLWPDTLAPVYSQHGGSIATGATVALTDPNTTAGGILYYTIDGRDPRIVGGAVAPTAQAYASPVAIDSSLVLKSRTLALNGEWSPLQEAIFTPSLPQLVFSEIHYNPPGTSDATEYIEILNAGTLGVNLSGMTFSQGIDFTFNGGRLEPGQRLLVVKSQAAFSALYPAVPASQIAGEFANLTGLDNGGEQVTLVDVAGRVLCSVVYNDEAGWPTEPDSGGHSLVLMRPGTTDMALPTSWRRSVALNGNPGGSDALGFVGDPAADADDDGFSALVEYAAGTSDTEPAQSPLLPAWEWLALDPLEPNALTAVVSCVQSLAAEDVTCVLEVTDGLTAWTSGPGATQPHQAVKLDAGRNWTSWSVALPAATSQRLFVRWKVSRN